MSVEGFYHWFAANATDCTQKRLFLPALGRLARMVPDEDPTEVITGYLSDCIYQYSVHLQGLELGVNNRVKIEGKRHQRAYRPDLPRADEIDFENFGGL